MTLLADYLAGIRERLHEVRGWDWSAMPEPPDEPPAFSGTRLQPLPTSSFPTGSAAALPFEAVRFDLQAKVADYIYDPGAKGLLLVRVPAGVGKTHALITATQAFATPERRVLWAAGSHSGWDDLTGFENFKADRWHHWQGIMRIDRDVPMCRYAQAQQRWMARGYNARDLCHALCLADGWMEHSCPYRAQERVTAPCVFGMHNHLTAGLPLAKFALAIVDELPLRAFVRERVIPFSGIAHAITKMHDRHTVGPVVGLYTALYNLAYTKKLLAGRALFDVIGPHLSDVYAQVELNAGNVVTAPQVYCESAVFDVEYNFLGDLLDAATLGYEAWRAEWPDWAHRVWVSSHGVHILQRQSLWDELPLKVVALDATAQPELYGLMFRTRMQREDGTALWARRKVREVYAPEVARLGQLRQITGRLYSKRALYKVTKSVTIRANEETHRHIEVQPLRGFTEALAVIAELAHQHGAQRVGLITYQAIEQAAAAELTAQGFTVASGHFYNMRGSNALQSADVVFVLGTPTPRPADIVNNAVALDQDRRAPFDIQNGGAYCPRVVEFPMTRAGLSRAILDHDWPATTRGVGRVVFTYADATLRAVHSQLREAEIAQAGHRGRVNIQDVPVYILTATPVGTEPLDCIYDDPPVAPQGINWRTWLFKVRPWLEQCLAEGREVDAESLAAAIDVRRDYIMRNNWLEAIVAYDQRWQIVKIAPASGRGRRRTGIGGRRSG